MNMVKKFKKAEKNNKDPKIFCDELSEKFRSLNKNIKFNK